VRLDYAGIAHVMEADPVAAVGLARSRHDAGAPAEDSVVDVIGNYTAFGELLRSKA
jgi:hypothetical protein